MKRQTTPDVLGEPDDGHDIVATTFGAAPVILPDLKWQGYAGLDPEARIVVQQRTGEIRRLVRKTAQGVIDIGSYLIDVKAYLDYGLFGDWLDAEFAWSERTARRFMTVAEQFKTANLAELSIAPSALYLLASPSTPEPARAEVIERARAGEPITHQAAREVVEQHAPPRPPVANNTIALNAVRKWLLDAVPASKRMYALQFYNSPPFSNTIKPYITGLQSASVRQAVSTLKNNPDLITQAPAPPIPAPPAPPPSNGNGPKPAPAIETALAGIPVTKGPPDRPAPTAVKTVQPGPRDLSLDELRLALLELFSLPASATNAEILQAAILAQSLAVEAANA